MQESVSLLVSSLQTILISNLFYRYRFSWSPKGVLNNLKSAAKWLEDGEVQFYFIHTNYLLFFSSPDNYMCLNKGVCEYEAGSECLCLNHKLPLLL